MKKLLIPAFLMTILASSCKKDDPPAAAATVYFTTTTGSSYTYKSVDNTTSASDTYTIVSSNRDSTIGSRSYHVFTNSTDGSSEYYHMSGNSYFQFANLTNFTDPLELNYLQSDKAVGETWSQNISIDAMGVPLTATLTYTVEDKSGSLTVNGTSYTNVTRVKTDVSIAGIPPTAVMSNIKSYYVAKRGMIKRDAEVSINYLGISESSDLTVTLESSNVPL